MPRIDLAGGQTCLQSTYGFCQSVHGLLGTIVEPWRNLEAVVNSFWEVSRGAPKNRWEQRLNGSQGAETLGLKQ